jgi:hypothetical protein
MFRARNDNAIEFHNNATWPDLKLIEQDLDANSLRHFLFFAVNSYHHGNKKTVFASAIQTVAREYGLKFTPKRAYAWAITLALPCAGAIRIRFEGLPDSASGSQSKKQTPLAWKNQ